MKLEYDKSIKKWVASREGLEAVDSIPAMAVAILLRMETEQ